MRALIQIRAAQPADAEVAAILMYSAYTHTQVTIPLRDEHKSGFIERLQHFFRQDGNRFSYQNIQVTEGSSAVVGRQRNMSCMFQLIWSLVRAYQQNRESSKSV